MKPGAPKVWTSMPSMRISWLKPGAPLIDFDHWLPVTPGVKKMKFSICRRPVAPAVATPPREMGRSSMSFSGNTVPISAVVV